LVMMKQWFLLCNALATELERLPEPAMSWHTQGESGE
jgi:hypothetical protein